MPVTIKETIPEPGFTLKSPDAMEWPRHDRSRAGHREPRSDASGGCGRTAYSLVRLGGAVIQQIAPDRLILKRSQFTGPLTVTCEINNGGRPRRRDDDDHVTEPKTDPVGAAVPEKDEKPEEGQFYARDDKRRRHALLQRHARPAGRRGVSEGLRG